MGIVTTTFKRKVSISTGDSNGVTPTRVQNSGNQYIARTAAASTITFSVPLQVDSLSGQLGTQLVGLDILFRATTANMASNIKLNVYRRNASIPVVGTPGNITTSTLSGTLSGNGLTANAADRLMTWVATTPITWDYSLNTKADYSFELIFNCGSSTVLWVYNAIAYYNLPS